MRQKIALNNGLTVLFVPTSPGSGALSLQFWVKVGSTGEGPWLGSGISHYLEHMVFKGTGRRTSRDINLRAEILGGHLNAYTSYDRTVYHIDAPIQVLAECLDLLSDFVLYPVLREEDLRVEKEVILREISMCNDSPSEMLFQYLMYHGFPEELSRHPVIGWRERFADLEGADVRLFHQLHYQTSQITVLVVGDLQPKHIGQATEYLGALIPGKKPVMRGGKGRSASAEDPLSEKLACGIDQPLVRRGSWDSSQGLLLYPLAQSSRTEALQAEWLSRYLAGSNQSLLRRKIRQEKELVHSIHSDFFSVGNKAYLAISYRTEPDLLAEAESAILEQLEMVRGSSFFLDDAMDSLRGLQFDLLCDLQTADQVAERSGDYELLFGEGDKWDEFKQLNWLTDSLQGYLREVLSPDRARVGRSLPKNVSGEKQ